jgi:hypothetical protein
MKIEKIKVDRPKLFQSSFLCFYFKEISAKSSFLCFYFKEISAKSSIRKNEYFKNEDFNNLQFLKSSFLKSSILTVIFSSFYLLQSKDVFYTNPVLCKKVVLCKKSVKQRTNRFLCKAKVRSAYSLSYEVRRVCLSIFILVLLFQRNISKIFDSSE